MDIIPVIDIKGGVVVRARLGQRDAYRPLETPLAQSSAPAEVVAGFLRLYPFRAIYVADLDAIMSAGASAADLKPLIDAFPSVSFWIDAGLGDVAAARAWLARHVSARLVLGSETLAELASLAALTREERLILSLDFREDVLLGPERLWERPQHWPCDIIVMTLARIGADAGPDFMRLEAVKARAPHARLYAAGGVRGRGDLMRLREAGSKGTLIASALHAGRITGTELALFSRDVPRPAN